MPKPYKFPARSRLAMVAALENIGGYQGWHAPGRRAWPFAWNVKIYMHNYDELAETLEPHNDSGVPFNPAFDRAFSEHMEEESSFWAVVENMRRNSEDWHDFDGGDGYEFEYAGRCGGNLVLTHACGRSMSDVDFDEMREDKDEWPFADVRALYRAVTVMDKDFSREAVRKEWLFCLASERAYWEEGKRLEREEAERALIAEAFKGEMSL